MNYVRPFHYDLLTRRAEWPSVRMHRTYQKASIAGAVVHAAVKVGTDAEAPRTGRVICIERIQPVVASREENAVAIAGLEKDTFHVV